MNNKTSITALMSSFGRAFHAENEEHPVFADYLAKELMTAEEYTAVQNYILGGAQFFEPEINHAEQIPKELLRKLINTHIVGDLGHRDGVLVDFLDPGAHLHASAPRSVLVVAAVRRAAGREVRVDREVLALENLDRCVDQLVEVVRQNLGGHADGDSLGTLCEKQREAYRQFGRLLVTPVV